MICCSCFFMIKCTLMIVQIFKTCRGLDYLQMKAQENGACHMFNTTLNFFLPLATNFLIIIGYLVLSLHSHRLCGTLRCIFLMHCSACGVITHSQAQQPCYCVLLQVQSSLSQINRIFKEFYCVQPTYSAFSLNCCQWYVNFLFGSALQPTFNMTHAFQM